MDALKKEIETHQKISHPHIVRFVGADTTLPNEVRLFMEYIPLTLDVFFAPRYIDHPRTYEDN